MGKIQNKSKIILYHGSDVRVTNPDLGHCRGQKDFGVGFYLTTDKRQAEKFARSRAYESGSPCGYVNQYFVESFDGLDILEFETTDTRWLKFICTNRQVRAPRHNKDVIIGKIADDDTRRTLNMYMRGAFNSVAKNMGITPEELTIMNLKPENLKNQLCFCTNKSLGYLKFVKSTVVR